MTNNAPDSPNDLTARGGSGELLVTPNSAQLDGGSHDSTIITQESPRAAFENVASVVGTDSGAGARFIRVSAIAKALGLDKRTVRKRAHDEQWPTQQAENRIDVCPPPHIAAIIPRDAHDDAPASEPKVRFTDLADSETERARAMNRKAVIDYLTGLLASGCPKEAALWSTSLYAHNQLAIEMSTRTIRRLHERYLQHGLNGLVDQKRGNCGSKSCMDKLDPAVRAEIVTKGKALAVDHGQRGGVNIAKAARELSVNPHLPAALRGHLHQGHQSKSYVTPSVRAAIRPAPLTALLAEGTRRARLSSRFTTGDYSKVRAGDVFTADDMTSNVLCWVEWPNQLGFRIAQAQVLPMMDFVSQRWLNVRVVIRPSGAYTTDDIAGLCGDVFDTFGLPREGVVFEGNLWQSRKVKGHSTGVSAEDRVGGLESLGLKVWHTHTPGGKAVIESSFNKLQTSMDACRGYIGREQRYDLQENEDRKRSICERGGAHPSEYFLHVSQLADHIVTCMANLNNERNDGQLLKGDCAIDRWVAEATDLAKLTDQTKWMYRSCLSVVAITRNGLRITQGSGKNQRIHLFDNPEVLTHWQGHKVAVYWNDYNPDADAVVLLCKPGGKRQFLCLAKAVQAVPRFSATPEQLATEKARQAAGMNVARVELRSIQPEMQRGSRPVPFDRAARDIGEKLKDASHRAETETRKTEQFETVSRRAANFGREVHEETHIGNRESRPAPVEEIEI